MRKATELVMLSQPVNATDACAMGLVNRVVPADRLDAAVQEFAEQLASGATRAFAHAKRLLTQSYSTSIQQHLDDEIASFAECARTDDFKEGVTAFVEKRQAHFKGR